MCECVQPPTGMCGVVAYENVCAHPHAFCNFSFIGEFFHEVASFGGLFIYKLCSCCPTCWERRRMAIIQQVLMCLPGTKGGETCSQEDLNILSWQLKTFCNPYLCLGNGFWNWEFENMDGMYCLVFCVMGFKLCLITIRKIASGMRHWSKL